MKSINLIKLLSVLLCIVMLLAACSSGDKGTETTADKPEENTNETSTQTEAETEAETEAATEEETEEGTMAPVEPVLENFFGFEYNDGIEDIDADSLERIDGEVIAACSDNNVIVIKNSDVDFKNVVTDTYTVYNVSLGKQVLEITNQYKYGYYDEVDWNNLVVKETVSQTVDPNTLVVTTETNVDKYPETAVAIFVNETTDFCYVTVATAKFTEIEDDVRAENPDGCYYSVETKWEYYDVAGQLIKSSNVPCEVTESHGAWYFGSTCAVFDEETDQLVCTTDSETQTVVGAYDVENEKYGYIYGARTGALGSRVDYVDVFDKESGARKLRYYFDTSAMSSNYFVLKNGNIVIQNIFELPEDSFADADINIGNSIACSIETEILNVRTGSVEEIEFNYLIGSLFSKEELAEVYELEKNGVTLTDNVVNAVFAYEFGDLFSNDIKVVVLDNKLNVLFELDKIIPEHLITPFGNIGIETLATGDYLLALDNVVTNRAIVTKDGVVRAYLSSDMIIKGQYVISETGIFDFDLNLLYNFEENDCELFNTIGDDGIIVRRACEVSIWDEANNVSYERTYFEYYLLTETVDETTGEELTFKMTQLDFDVRADGSALNADFYYYYSNGDENGYDKVVISKMSDDYFITYNVQLDKYTMWTVDFEHVLTSDADITVLEFGEKYLIKTSITEPDYTVKEILYTLGRTADGE